MTDRMEWSGVVGQSLSDVIRERANSALMARVEHEILALWRSAYAADPTSPPPPDTSLAVNPWWWTSINAATLDIEACAPEIDPIARLGATDPRAATHLPWAENRIAAFRADSLRAEARKLFDALAADEVRLTGIREPSLAHGGARQDVPAAALRSRQWRLTADSTLIALAIGTSDTVAFGDTRLAVAATAEAPAPAADPRPKQNNGGRPAHKDRDAFDREVTRRLALDGGNMTTRQFRIGMKQWAATNLEPVPDDRTIERWIDRLVSPGVLTE